MDRLRDQIGQLLVVGFAGAAPDAGERLLFEECGFGGYLLFRRNCENAAQVASLCRALWDSGGAHPPFIAIDQEGGRVHRLPVPFTHFPAAKNLGSSGGPERARRAGRDAGLELALAGINLDFAPVLDVDSNPANPVIGDRAFAADPAAAAASALAWMEGVRSAGIIPCGKHFPGHGDTDKDSHLELPAVTKSAEELNRTELPPFVQACRGGIDSLMTAHVLYPALDPLWPATLSEKIVTGLLRQQLGYDGVVFSDDMEMKAISGRYGTAEAAAISLRAGVDVLLLCHETVRAAEVLDALHREAEQDASLRRRIAQSYTRVVKLKTRKLCGFTGVAPEAIAGRLARLQRQRGTGES